MDPDVKTQPAYGVFSFFKPAFTAIIEELATDPKAAIEQMKDCFAVVAPTLPYLDEPENPMAMSLLSCAASLALYVVLRDTGVDVHNVGRSVHDAFSLVSF